MEFEDVSERIEWDARRVAAAFGIDEPITESWNGLFASVQGTCVSDEPFGVAAYLFVNQITFVFTGQSEFSRG